MTERPDVVRDQLTELVRSVPFVPFVITLENGLQLTVGHPENIAFDIEGKGSRASNDLYVISGNARYIGHLHAVTGIVKSVESEIT